VVTLCVSVSQHALGSQSKRTILDSTSVQFRLNLQGREIRGAFMREFNTRTLKPKKLSFANEGPELTGPCPCRFSAAAVWHVSPFAAGRDRRPDSLSPTLGSPLVSPGVVGCNWGPADRAPAHGPPAFALWPQKTAPAFADRWGRLSSGCRRSAMASVATRSYSAALRCSISLTVLI
jgi:hypothetical protein